MGVAYGTVSGGSVTYTAGDAAATFSAPTGTAIPGAPAIAYGAPQGMVYETNLQAEAPTQTMYVQGDVPAQTMFVQGEAGMQMQPPEMAAQTITYGAPQYEVPGQTMEVGGQAYAVQGQNITYGISGQVEVGQGQTITYGAPSAQFEVQPAEGGVGGSGFVTYSAPPQPEMQGQVTYTTPEMPQGQVTYTTPEMPQGQGTYTTPEMVQGQVTYTGPKMPQGQVTYTGPEMPQGQVTYTTPEIQGQVTYTTPQSVVGGQIGFGGPTIQQCQIGGPQQGSVTIGGTVGYGGQPIQGQIGVPQPTMQGQEFTSNMTVGIQGQIGGNYQGQIVGGMPGQVVQGIPQATYTMGSGAVTQGLSYQIPGQVGYAANSGYQMAGQAGYVYGGAGYTQYSTMMQTGAGASYTPRGQNMQVQGQTSSSYTPPVNYTYGAPSAEITYGAPQADMTYGATAPVAAAMVTPEIVMAQPVQPQKEGLLAAESMLCYTSGPQAQPTEGQESTSTKKGKVTKDSKKKKSGGCC